MKLHTVGLTLGLSLSGLAIAPATAANYTIDSSHTYPSFEADHLGGVSKWRGKINKTSGTLQFDPDAETGAIDVKMEMSTIDFGFEKMNEHALKEDIFYVEKYPQASYTSSQFVFEDGKLVAIEGELTLKGVTQPVTLTVNEYLCKQHPMIKKEVCGADASATINRGDFGVDYALNFGFKPEVKLAIQVEAIRND